MRCHVFDLSLIDPGQVREFLKVMAKSGLVGGVYLWINSLNGKMYVGSSIDLCSRISAYFSLNRAHGIIGEALRKYGLVGFTLVVFFMPNITSSSVLALEQGVLDNCVCDYNINPTADSRAGVKHSEETRSKMSCSKLGQKHSEETRSKMSCSKLGQRRENTPRFNTGKRVFLYIVHNHVLELTSTYFNRSRLAEFLGVPRSTLFNYIQNRTLFQVNGVSYIASWEGDLTTL